MRIGVSLVGFDPAYVGGVTTFALGLVKGLINNRRGYNVVLFGSEDARSFFRGRLGAETDVCFVTVRRPFPYSIDRLSRLPVLDRTHTRVRNLLMRSARMKIAAHCDVILFPLCHMWPYRPDVPSIVSFHDLQHETFPEFFGWYARRSRRVQFGATFRHASLVQASSLAMKSEALRVYADRLAPDRVAVIPEGVDFALFAAPATSDARASYGLPEEFLFYPAQLWHHKNHLRLIAALDRIRERDQITIPLVLTGADFDAAPRVRAYIKARELGAQIRLLGKVSFPALLSLYKQARYLVSASLHESNCLPILEAAASGTPIIAADIPANRETAERFVIRLFDPLDVEDIAETLVEAWRNRHANEAAVAQNREAAQNFDWGAIADLYIDAALGLTAPPACVPEPTPRTAIRVGDAGLGS